MNACTHFAVLHSARCIALALAFCTARVATAQENNQPPEGFTALFNGRDFKDWSGAKTRDPREIAALPPKDRAAWDEQMRQGIAQHWRVANGELISDGHDPYLATTRDFTDFELRVDWKIGPEGDSGIYLRGTPQVQIWDPSNEKAKQHGADKGSGALWNNKQHERFPLVVADNPVGQWNRMVIRMVGPYVLVRLNGKLVVNNVVMENYYAPNEPIFRRGPIYLQTHGAETRFRNVFLREIPHDEANRLLGEIKGDDANFSTIFNGHDLAGWQGDTGSVEVINRELRFKEKHVGNVLTTEEYANFIARLEFKLPPGGNNGLAIRSPFPVKVPAFDALELQLLDDDHPKYATLHPYQFCCSVYGLAPPRRGFLRPAGEWNFEEVRVDGDRIEIELNGFPVLSANLAEVRKNPADEKKHPGAANKSGHFGFCGHNDPVAFRNIRIRRLP